MGYSAKYLTEIKLQTSLHPPRFVNPVKNETKAIKLACQRWPSLPQLPIVLGSFPLVVSLRRAGAPSGVFMGLQAGPLYC